jgi:hypothetical protein
VKIDKRLHARAGIGSPRGLARVPVMSEDLNSSVGQTVGGGGDHTIPARVHLSSSTSLKRDVSCSARNNLYTHHWDGGAEYDDDNHGGGGHNSFARSHSHIMNCRSRECTGRDMCDTTRNLFPVSGPAVPPRPRTMGEVAVAVAHVSRRESEVSAREASAAERDAAAVLQRSEFQASSSAQVAAVLEIAGEAEAAGEAASKSQAANVALAAQLDRREADIEAREAREESIAFAAACESVASREREAGRVAESLRAQSAAVTRREEVVTRREEVVERRDEDVATRVATAEARETALREVIALTRERESACVVHAAQLKAYEGAVKRMTAAAERREADVGARATAVEDRDRAGETRAAEMADTAGALADAEADLDRRAAELARRETAAAELGVKAAAKLKVETAAATARQAAAEEMFAAATNERKASELARDSAVVMARETAQMEADATERSEALEGRHAERFAALEETLTPITRNPRSKTLNPKS